MKHFTTIKVGYTAGLNGCSNEFFTTIITDDKGMHSISFKGLYGAENRIAQVLTNKGYEQHYTPSSYGKMTNKDVSAKVFLYETQALETIVTL